MNQHQREKQDWVSSHQSLTKELSFTCELHGTVETISSLRPNPYCRALCPGGSVNLRGKNRKVGRRQSDGSIQRLTSICTDTSHCPFGIVLSNLVSTVIHYRYCPSILAIFSLHHIDLVHQHSPVISTVTLSSTDTEPLIYNSDGSSSCSLK